MCHDSNWETLKRVRGGFSDRRLVLDLIRLSTLEAVKGAADDGERLEEHRERETKTPGAPADDWSAVLDRNRAAKKPRRARRLSLFNRGDNWGKDPVTRVWRRKTNQSRHSK